MTKQKLDSIDATKIWHLYQQKLENMIMSGLILVNVRPIRLYLTNMSRAYSQIKLISMNIRKELT